VTSASRRSNLFADIPSRVPEELIEVLQATGAVRIERIVSMGHRSPDGFWYDQETDEWVLLLRGAARLEFEGADQRIELKPGDFLAIPAHQRHRMEWTSPDEPTVWLAVHCENQR
jgi:cupin 2 domain-containing protein